MVYNDNYYMRLRGRFMDEYTLYLDESKNKEKTLFLISGIIVKNSEIDNLGNR